MDEGSIDRADRSPVSSGGEIRSLYVHVPFCGAKCRYCAFYTIPDGADDPARVDAWATGLRREVVPWLGRLNPVTVYVGGGTPTRLPPRDLARVLAWIRTLSIEPPAEWTVEANPETIDRTRASILAAAGVTRVSLGVQSFDPAVLRRLGRSHDPDTVVRAIETIRAAGIRSVSADLIAATPGESEASWERTLAHTIELGVDHASVYCLAWEPGTALTRDLRAGRIRRATTEQELHALRIAGAALGAAGFRRYEVASYARPGARCRHNIGYWRLQPSLGIGPAAASYVDGTRWSNPPDLAGWVEGLRSGHPVRHDVEPASPRRRAVEAAVFGLRMPEGWTRAAYHATTGTDWDRLWGPRIAELRAEGLLVADPDRLAPTARGLEVVDAIGELFVDG